MLAAALTARDHITAATAMLADAGLETPRVDAEWLLAGLLSIGRAALRLRLDRALEPATVERYAVAVGRRARREPLQRVLGWEEFRGLRLRLSAEVLVPRPETEILTDWALALLPPLAAGWQPLVIDVGTGSGCIACAVAAERPDARVLAIDRSARAACVARDNARALGLERRVHVIAGDLLAPVAEPADVIVANPPYLPAATIGDLAPEVAHWEPRVALDGGPDGLAVIRALVPAAAARLRPGGALVLETGGGAQILAVTALLRGAGLGAVQTRADLASVERFVAGRRA